MSRRRLAIALTALGLVVALVVGWRQAIESSSPSAEDTSAPSPAEVRRALVGAPAPLAALHRQANALLPGGEDAYRARLRELRGFPVLVNIWASWCGPCREELPLFQRATMDFGRRVGFLGVDLRDSRAKARELLDEFPLAYPSYEDEDGSIFTSYGLQGVPSTIFYDAAGRQTYAHQGQYLEREQLEDDIARYALRRPSTAARSSAQALRSP